MSKYFTLILQFLFLSFQIANAQSGPPEKKDARSTELWAPKPVKVTPGVNPGDAPSDAIILFDGKDLSKWSTNDGKDAKWEVKDGNFTVVRGAGGIKTRQTFGDIQLHIEWRTPLVPEGSGQSHGNSGIFFQEKYELQVLDNYEVETYVNGLAGSLYKQYIPLVDPSRKTNEWQSYDVIYNAPRFSEKGTLVQPGHVTVFFNGVLVQNSSALWGPTSNVGSPLYEAHGKGSISLQDHGNGVSFRNIWVREL